MANWVLGEVVGMGSKSSVRNAMVQFDDKPVPTELRAACGYVSVLTVVEIRHNW